jgi:hypothetical protein
MDLKTCDRATVVTIQKFGILDSGDPASSLQEVLALYDGQRVSDQSDRNQNGD